MKTSQEIAEEMATVAAERVVSPDNPMRSRADAWLVTKLILSEIPLTAFIEVARSANGMLTTENNSDMLKFELALESAVEKLKQTKKAEWL